MNKKRFFAIFTIIFISANFLAFSREPKSRKFFGTNFSIGAAIPLYTDSTQWSTHQILNQQNYARMIFANSVGVSMKLAKPLFFVCDADFSYDLAWKQGYYLNAVDIAFSTGFQFYPNTKRLSVAVEYCLGTRIDSVNLPEEIKAPKSSNWGNGFKIAAEFDLIEGGGIVPIAGTYYRFMPRGQNEYDNIFSIYFKLAFR